MYPFFVFFPRIEIIGLSHFLSVRSIFALRYLIFVVGVMVL